MANILIIGSNRGIGLALATQYLQRGDTVYGTSRGPNPLLEEKGGRCIVGVDMTTDEGAQALRAGLEGVSIHTAVINAGVLVRTPLSNLNFDLVLQQIQVNAIGVLRMAHSLQSFLSTGSKLGIVTSRMGSIADNTSGGSYGYRMSKSAVNSAGKSLSIDLAPGGVAVRLLHPGWVQTEMTGGTGHVTADEAAEGLIECMDTLTLESTGEFWHAQGTRLPW